MVTAGHNAQGIVTYWKLEKPWLRGKQSPAAAVQHLLSTDQHFPMSCLWLFSLLPCLCKPPWCSSSSDTSSRGIYPTGTDLKGAGSDQAAGTVCLLLGMFDGNVGFGDLALPLHWRRLNRTENNCWWITS